jgi:hypothetical protein
VGGSCVSDGNCCNTSRCKGNKGSKTCSYEIVL